MYFLSKFCRICIKTGVQLTDIEAVDVDKVRLSEKLEICMKMVINRESLSTQICMQCIKKLRISYDFHKICQQSSKILQGYLTELISTSTKICPDSFVNSELRVTLTPLSRNAIKRKRITKEQRCSLLKKLLLSTKTGVHKRRQKPKKKLVKSTSKGGLKNIIEFTRNYDFGYKIDNSQNSASPLTKLASFTNNFFLNNFTEFKNTILYIIENRDSLFESDDDEIDMFDSIPDESPLIKCEELVVEPDIKIKTEIDFEDCDSYSCNYYVETSYSDSECKKENIDIADDGVFIKQENCGYGGEGHNSVQMLDRLVGNLTHRKTFSPHSVRCRTRGNPYINPELRQQFQMRSFQCDKCNRYFKSPGYLKAHVSKVHP